MHVTKLKSFKEWIVEAIGEKHDFSSLTPYHAYTTPDGHKITVHVFNGPKGKHAISYNHDADAITKMISWGHSDEPPKKSELETLGREDHNLNESLQGKDVSSDTAGKLAEHAMAGTLIHYKHEQQGTVGSPEHHAEVEEHKTKFEELAKGHDPAQVELRRKHGEQMAHVAMESLKLKHGPSMKLKSIGQTSKSGDIGKFTKGKHNDGQENPSDVSVEVSNSEKSSNPKESHYEGFSLKSSGKSKNITAKNPKADMGGILDTESRKLGTEKIARDGLHKIAVKMGHGDKTSAERSRVIDDARKKEGVTSGSSIELEANNHAMSVKKDVSNELHAHLSHLIETGHHRVIGKMLEHHLSQSTDMPWSKLHAQGDKPTNVKATLTAGSDSPMNKIFRNKATRYAVTTPHDGARVSIHKVNSDGTHTTIAHYAPKPKSNALKENTMGWNVVPASTH